MTTIQRPRQETGDRAAGRRPYLMLGVAAVGFALTFWAWALLSPLGAYFRQSLGLTSFQQALVVAVPVIVGALGRIPVGALTDRYGGRLMFPIVSFATIAPGIYGASGSYAWGLLALAAVAASAMIYSFSTPSRPVRTRAA